MLRNVLGKTWGCCSSTKLAELSNPDIPSMAAEKPKNNAFQMEDDCRGIFQLISKREKPCSEINTPEAKISITKENK